VTSRHTGFRIVSTELQTIESVADRFHVRVPRSLPSFWKKFFPFLAGTIKTSW
jgi:hypothetical protein